MIGDTTNIHSTIHLNSLEDIATLDANCIFPKIDLITSHSEFVKTMIDTANRSSAHVKLRALDMLKREYPEELV